VFSDSFAGEKLRVISVAHPTAGRIHFSAKLLLDLDPELLKSLFPRGVSFRGVLVHFHLQTRAKVRGFFQRRTYEKEFGPPRIFQFRRGKYVGRRFTRDGAPKPFVVDAKATMLKRNSKLSKHARQLYMTLRALADGKTGELRIEGRWLKATFFDREAEMCRVVRLVAMRELIAAGLVSLNRPRVRRIIGGRSRVVMGEAQYTVFREAKPKNEEKPKDSSKVCLQKSVSRSVQETDRQILPKPPLGASTGFGVEDFDRVGERSDTESSSKAPASDDDLRARERAIKSLESKKAEAKTILLSKGHYTCEVEIALMRVSDLAAAKGSVPRSASYFVTSVERALEDFHEYAAIKNILEDRAANGISDGAPLEPHEKHNASKIALVHSVVEEAAREGRRATEVLAERLGASDNRPK
jgi:hypothetical protein